MAYVKLIGGSTEWQGDSYTKSIFKEDGSTWDAVYGGDFVLVNSAGVNVSTGALVRSGDNLSLTAKVSKDDTATITGEHKLLVRLTRSDDADFGRTIGEYDLEYLEKKA